MTMNPVHGELSPAMRNRGVEIFMSRRFSPPGGPFELPGQPVQQLARYPEASLVSRQAALMKAQTLLNLAGILTRI